MQERDWRSKDQEPWPRWRFFAYDAHDDEYPEIIVTEDDGHKTCVYYATSHSPISEGCVNFALLRALEYIEELEIRLKIPDALRRSGNSLETSGKFLEEDGQEIMALTGR